jgi:SHS2 domain-containing protein
MAVPAAATAALDRPCPTGALGLELPFEDGLAAMTDRHWENFAHDADVGVRGVGPTKQAAFAEAARALTAAVVDPDAVAPLESVAIACVAPDDEVLLLDWLNAVVYEMATRRMLFSAFDVTIAGHALKATVKGEPVDVVRHAPAVEVKGATFTELRVARDATSGKWTAQCVIDV